MQKKILVLCVLFWVVGNCFADNIQAVIEINDVTVDVGLVYVAVYSNERDYKDEIPFISFILEPINTTLTYSVELPEGEYVVSSFQDKNGDGKLNSTIFGIPTEHVGKTNYSLRGAPSGFNKLKAPVNNSSTKLIVNMGRVKPLGVI
ncbi:MAG: DUF2141 domain-containing protein [Treponema sp.]|jgi:uncharacterized protein (DUF2141 family)|nr:DUF2141 domain-containing protein [Treponema sp.]